MSAPRELFCAGCGMLAVVINDGKLRKGVVVYCKSCAPQRARKTSTDMPEFMSGLFGGKL